MSHVRYQSSVPLGKVRVEYRCRLEHCRSIVNAMVDTIQNKLRRRDQNKSRKREERRKKKIGENTEVDERHKERKNQRSGRTLLHVCHRRRVPSGKVPVECRCRIERCRSQCHGGPNPKQGKKKNEEMRKGEKTKFEGRNKERKNKEVQWTYFLACLSPPPCPTWKGPR